MNRDDLLTVFAICGTVVLIVGTIATFAIIAATYQ